LGDLTAADKKLLSEWINPVYLGRAAERRMVAQWEASSCIELRSFLREDREAAMLDAVRREDAAAAVGGGAVPARDAGVAEAWEAVGPPHKQRFLQANASAGALHATAPPAAQDPHASAAMQMRAVVAHLFRSAAFAKWLARVTDLGVTSLRCILRRFRPGLDYTVATGAAHDSPPHITPASPPPLLDATLCFVDDDGEEKATAWASDDVGGFQCYIAADDEADAAAETYTCALSSAGVRAASSDASPCRVLRCNLTCWLLAPHVTNAGHSDRT
jgi:prolyl 3-hydroxylase /prolyl 3,4-dihydroxylase